MASAAVAREAVDQVAATVADVPAAARVGAVRCERHWALGREATLGFSLSMLSLMTALIVGVEARACMALGCNKRAWQVESRPAESSSDRMCASVGRRSEHVGRKRAEIQDRSQGQ